MYEIEWQPKAYRQLKKIKDSVAGRLLAHSIRRTGPYPNYSHSRGEKTR
jgi:hypothetical protein